MYTSVEIIHTNWHYIPPFHSIVKLLVNWFNWEIIYVKMPFQWNNSAVTMTTIHPIQYKTDFQTLFSILILVFGQFIWTDH